VSGELGKIIFLQEDNLARLYHFDIARFAAGADPKWVDNLLSRFDVPGVEGARQGLSRRISEEGIYHIVLVRILNSDIGLGVNHALSVAGRLLSSEDGRLSLAEGLELRLDLAGFRSRVDAAIAEGVESLAPARRGRPPRASGDRG
jgi:hypothetical protein